MRKELLIEILPLERDKRKIIAEKIEYSMNNKINAPKDCYVGDDFYFLIEDYNKSPLDKLITCECYRVNSPLDKPELNERPLVFLNDFLYTVENLIYFENDIDIKKECEFYFNSFKCNVSKLLFSITNEFDLAFITCAFQFKINTKDIDDEKMRELCHTACHNLKLTLDLIEKIGEEFSIFIKDFSKTMLRLEKIAETEMSKDVYDNFKNALKDLRDKGNETKFNHLKLWSHFLNKKLERGENIIRDFVKFIYYLWEKDFYFIAHYQAEDHQSFKQSFKKYA